MWIKQLPSGNISYCERYTDYLTGKKKEVSVTYTKDTARNRKEAAYILAERINKTMYISNNNNDLTLSQLINEYRKDQINTVRMSTYRRNYYALETIKDMLGGDTKVNKLTARYIRERFLSTKKEGSTLNEHLRRFKAAIRWGYTADLITDISFLDKIERFPDAPYKEKIADKFLEKSELQLLLSEMKHPVWKLLTEFLALSGLRCGEAIALEKKDIDIDNKLIHITKTYDYINDMINPAKTVNSIDDVHIQVQLEDTINRINLYMNEQSVQHRYKTDLFFSDIKGDHIQYAAFNKYFQKATSDIIGKPLSSHSLRHTHASLLFEQGFTIDEVARRLRHGDSQITRDVYVHVTKKLREKDAEKITQMKLI